MWSCGAGCNRGSSSAPQGRPGAVERLNLRFLVDARRGCEAGGSPPSARERSYRTVQRRGNNGGTPAFPHYYRAVGPSGTSARVLREAIHRPHSLVLRRREIANSGAPPLPAGPAARTMTHDYIRHRTTTLFAALNVLDPASGYRV